ncbi:hypothetical protein D3C73_1621720 [compost metagenome]
MGMNANDFIASAFKGYLIDTVIDVAKVQVERVGKALKFLRDSDEFRIVILGNAIHLEGRDGHQLAQGLNGSVAVLDPCI